MKTVFPFIILIVLSVPGLAAEKTVTLEVDKMTCNMCPITVKKALRKVDGVSKVVAKYEGNGKGWAQITFDPNKADVPDLTVATEAAGYPSRLWKKHDSDTSYTP